MEKEDSATVLAQEPLLASGAGQALAEPGQAQLAPAGLASAGPGAWTSARSAAVSSSAIRDLLALTAMPGIISLAGGLPDASAMPTERLSDCLAWALRQPGALQYSTTEGDPGLRGTLARWESDWCGLTVGASQILVTSGAQQGLDLIGKTLVDAGDVVVIEDPAYVGAIQAFQLAGARLVAVPQDTDGMDTAALAGQLAAGLRPKLIYTTATFHNPAGTTLTGERRRQLAGLAQRYGFVVVEDDAYRSLYFGSPPPAPVAAHAGLSHVVRLGTFSKILSPGLRVGWLAASPELIAAFTRVKQATDLHTSTLAQLALSRAAADDSWLAGHIAAIRELYRSRAGHLDRALEAAFGGTVASRPPDGGMFAWVRFTDGTSADALLQLAINAGVAFVPGSAFSPERRNGDAMRLCFATTAQAGLTEGIDRIARAHAQLRGERSGASAGIAPDREGALLP